MKKGKEKNTMREEYDFTGGIRGKYAKRFSDCRNKGERRGRSRGTKGTSYLPPVKRKGEALEDL
jgi:hypothetical protein